jgi:hypothetical protein
MTPYHHIFKDVRQGNTWNGATLAYADSEGTPPASALSSVVVEFKDNKDDTTARQTLTSEAGEVTITDADAWTFVIEPVILSLTARTYFVAVTTTDAAGVVKTYLTGDIKVKP